jgi:hypothetical protein
VLLASAATTSTGQTIEQLRAMLAERDATIAELRQRLERATPMPGLAAPLPVSPVQGDRRALERALVREGGALLNAGALELEPGFAVERHAQASRITGEAALRWRLGLPLDAQLEGVVPYKFASGNEPSGWGGLGLGLVKDLNPERKRDDMKLLAWVTRSFDTAAHPSSTPDNGSVAVGLGMSRSLDPLVLSTDLDVWRPIGARASRPGLAIRPGVVLALDPERALSASLALGRLPRLADSAPDEAVAGRSFANLTLALDLALTPRQLVSVGVGLRVMGPVAPLRFFVSFPLRE